MKIILIALIAIVASVSGQTVALNTSLIPVETFERSILIKGKVAGDWKTWLLIEAHNGDVWRADGYDPSYTRLVCDYKPLFRKLANGQWEIMFTSEIAKNLP